MRLRSFLMAGCLVALLGGCATGDRMGAIHEGMARSEVIAIIGNPDGFQRSGDYEALRYSNRLMGGWSWDRADYSVILLNGRVTEYGPGEVRQRGTNALVLVSP
jgi:hypothetical protein